MSTGSSTLRERKFTKVAVLAIQRLQRVVIDVSQGDAQRIEAAFKRSGLKKLTTEGTRRLIVSGPVHVADVLRLVQKTIDDGSAIPQVECIDGEEFSSA